MRRNLFALAAMLAALATGFEAHAACTAGNPNANVIESTPTSAFTDHGNGTVTHNLTGLMWKRCAEGQTWSGSTCTGSETAFTWANALIQAKDANFAGQTDWRLPNKKELESIVESCGHSPSINQTRFPNTPASGFWSGSSYVPVPAYAWIVYFYDGYTYADYKSSAYYARLVRGGQSFDAIDAQGDFTPDAFAFTDQTGVALSTVIASNSITVAGIGTVAPISIVGGEYEVNASGTWTAGAGTVSNGDTVRVRHTSAATYSTAVNTALTIGGVSDTFTSTTLAAPAAPPGPPDPPGPPGPPGGPGPGPTPPTPLVNIAVNGNSAAEVTLGNPVALTYQVVGCQGQEMFLVLNGPAMGVVWSYRTAAGQWIPLPANLADITPFISGGPADGGYFLYTGNVPVGDYELYFGCDFVTNAHLDYTGGTSINGVYDYILVHVR